MQEHRMWVILALSWLFCSGSHADEESRLQCNEQNVQDVVAFVLLEHNKGLNEGNQLALYQVLEARKAQNESGEVLSVYFTARESDCEAGGDKTWEECDYLKDSSKLLRHCRSRVLLKETKEIFAHQCSVEPHLIAEPRPPCLGCPEKIDVESEDIIESLTYSISKANLLSEHTHHFLLNTVTSATRQVIAGFRYKLQFDMQKSNCTKENFKDITEECHPDPTEVAFINCNSTVDVAPWRHELPDTTVNCQPGPLPTGFSRRRPPGWSPLRTIKRPAESSEESQETKSQKPIPEPTTSSQSIPVPTPFNASSINCPSKPWKVFDANFPLRPPPPPPRPDFKAGQGGLTDSDLEAILSL